MAAPTSTTPLRRAVIAALTTATTKTQALPVANLFVLARPATRAQSAAKVKGAPAVWVTVRDHAADPDALGLEMSTIRRESVVVEVECTYYAGSELFSAEHAAALVRIEDDRQLVISALLYPEALRYDPQGNDTGLDGGSLRFDGYRSIGPAPSPVPAGSTARLLTVTHLFQVKVELATAAS